MLPSTTCICQYWVQHWVMATSECACMYNLAGALTVFTDNLGCSTAGLESLAWSGCGADNRSCSNARALSTRLLVMSAALMLRHMVVSQPDASSGSWETGACHCTGCHAAFTAIVSIIVLQFLTTYDVVGGCVRELHKKLALYMYQIFHHCNLLISLACKKCGGGKEYLVI